MADPMKSGARVLLCPYMGVGHVMPMIMLAKHLVRLGLSITFLMPGRELYARAVRDGDTEGLDIGYEVVEFEQEEPGGVDRLVANGLRGVELDSNDYLLAYEDFLPKLKCIRLKLEELKLSAAPILCAVLDPFLFYEGIVVENVGLPVYAFIPFSTASVACFRYLMFNDVSPDATQLSIPGLPLLHGYDFPKTILRSSGHPRARVHADRNKWMQECCQGILLNSWEGIEEGAIAALRDPNVCHLPKALAESVFAIGPLGVTEIHKSAVFKSSEEAHCREWLNAQRPSSVLFVCFGSWLVLQDEQIYEIAMGLLASEVPFLWVLKSERFSWLDDFIQRTKGRGLVVVGWAPQQCILGHEAVGGFVMTCGWNSVIESITLSPRGIAIMAWPLYFDHLPTCRLLVDGLQIAAEVHGRDGAFQGLVEEEEIARVAKVVMLGPKADAMRSRAAILRNLACEAVAQGVELQAFVEKCTVSRPV